MTKFSTSRAQKRAFTLLFASVLVSLALLITGCASKSDKPAAKSGHPAAVGTTAPAPIDHNVSEPAEEAAPAADGQYVCPMHPEVTSDVPAKCPKCGMHLELN